MTTATKPTASTVSTTALSRQAARWAKRFGLGNKLVVALITAAIAGGLATYAALTATPPFGNDPNTVILLLTLDLVILLLLGAVISRRMVRIWTGRRQGLAGSRLHVRLVAMLSLLAVTPAILVAGFSVFFFYVGVQNWFSERVRTAVNNAQSVAEAYLHEHQQVLRGDALSMANDLNREATRVVFDPVRFDQIVDTQATLRELSEVLVFEGSGRILSRSGLTFTLELDPLPENVLERAKQGEVVLFVNEGDDRVRALVRLDRFVDTFLYVGRFVDPEVLAYMASTDDAVRAYTELEGQRSTLQVTVALIYIVVALLLLMVAVWYGLNFATQMVRPISALIGAAERVRAGDLSTRVDEREAEDELASLSRAFNRMTNQLETQRRDLMEANHQLDLRRRFTEAVLTGVSAGVLGLDQQGRINLPNASAARLLGLDDPSGMIDERLTDLVPEMGDMMVAIRRRPSKDVEGEVQIRKPGQPPRTLLVRMAADLAGGEVKGFVVTFDDVSDLLSAQRKAAWADVARRIAHEIKNPLTPIQLSAERLRRKYLKEVSSDPDTFQQCTDTIVRQVEDIRRMVDEFSAFARMPQAVMKSQDIIELAKQAVFLQSTANTGVHFHTDIPPHSITIVCDGRQVSQALTNLLQNALDAIDGRPRLEGQPLPDGEVALRLTEDDENITISVEDNGKGLPVEERDRLTEPYVTTRTKGTGLGLAIVKKIMEDHGGSLRLTDRAGGGAIVSLVLPKVQPQAVEADAEERKHVTHGA